MKKPVYVIDAFTDAPFRGNPAGVVLDGSDLDAKLMQRIAAELRHSETAFPLPAREPAAALHLRWFTPTAEVVFCGHATLATFHALVEEAKRLRAPEQGVHRTSFTCKAGLLRVELSRDAKKRVRVLIETPEAAFEPQPVSADFLASLGIVPEVLDPKVPPQRTSRGGLASVTGEGNLFLALRDRGALACVRPDFRALADAGHALGIGGACLFTLNPAPGVDAAVRCFFPGHGVDEDPVTGSAAGQLATLLQTALPETLPRKMVLTQGDELGRPGRVEVELRPEATPGKVRAWIGGHAATVLRGELDLRGA
jgi:PhzF family phenazine biosynthesis protein